MFLPALLCLALTPPVAQHRAGTVSLSQVESRGGPALYQARKALYDLQVRIAEDVAFDQQVERLALEGKKDPRAMVQAEVERRRKEPTPEDLQRLLPELRRSGALPADPKEAQARLLETAREQARARAFEAYRGEVLQASGLRMTLEPPRMEVAERTHAPSEGPSHAAVTVVVFSDFQCEACRTLHDALRTLRARYPSAVRIVHRQLPLDLHPRARPAALAWLRHGGTPALRDLLFAAAGDLAHPSLKEPLSLREGATEAEAQAWIDQDMEDAARLGLTGTPSLLLNGRLIPGAAPLDVLVRMVEEELFWKALQ